MSRPTLGDSPVKQPLGTGHGQQRADAHGTSRLAKDGDVLWIATKGGDILLYPLEGSDLVEQGAVGVSLVQREEAVDTETVIDGHAHDTVAGETTAVIPGPTPPIRTQRHCQESRPSPVAWPTRGRGTRC